MNDICFSVIVTAFNQTECIKKAVDSVLNQTYKNFELIVVDDCSTDNTFIFLSEYLKNKPNVKLLRHEKNSSSHAARATGVENAKGEFVIFLDGDDFLFCDALEKLYKEVLLTQNDFDVCEYSYKCLPSEKIVLPFEWNKEKPRIEYYLQDEKSVNVWNKLYRTQLLKQAFSKMNKSYIRCGDDTFESIAIAFFTKKYLQKDVLVLNYVMENGVSLRKNDFEKNVKHCESLRTSLNCLESFFDAVNFNQKELFLQKIEKDFFNWMLSVMKNNTKLSDVAKSLILLPKYFSLELIEPVFAKLYRPQLRLKKLKLLIRKFVR